MTVDLRDLPTFLTREDVANLLRLRAVRSVDRLVERGELKRSKLTARRTGFHRNDVGDLLERRGNAVIRPGGAPASAPPVSPFQAQREPWLAEGEIELKGHGPMRYASPMWAYRVKIEGGADPAIAEALDHWLAGHGCRGCIVALGDADLTVMWARRLPYTAKQIRRAIERVKAT